MHTKVFHITSLLVLGMIAVAMSGQKADDAGGKPTHKDIACAQVTIRLDKALYQPEDKIHVQGTVTNISKKALILNTRCSFPADIFLTIKTEHDVILKWLPPSPPRPLTKNDFTVLEPEEEIQCNLSFYRSFLYDPLDDGKYTIQAKYTNRIPTEYADVYPGKDTPRHCEDPVHSNIVSFEIHTPEE